MLCTNNKEMVYGMQTPESVYRSMFSQHVFGNQTIEMEGANFSGCYKMRKQKEEEGMLPARTNGFTLVIAKFRLYIWEGF